MMSRIFSIMSLSLLCCTLCIQHSRASVTTLNKGLPVMVDPNTELNNICLKDMTVTYFYQIKHLKLKQALACRGENKLLIEKNACADEDIHRLISKDLDVKFIYHLEDKKILEVCVNSAFCEHLNSKKSSEKPVQYRKINFNHV